MQPILPFFSFRRVFYSKLRVCASVEQSFYDAAQSEFIPFEAELSLNSCHQVLGHQSGRVHTLNANAASLQDSYQCDWNWGKASIPPFCSLGTKKPI